MRIYTYSEARQKLASLMKQAEATGKVIIKRKDGKTFSLSLVKENASPLEVPTIKSKISTREIINIIREGRKRK